MSATDARKTKTQLIAEIDELRQRLIEQQDAAQPPSGSHNYYQQLVERSPDAIFVHNGRMVLFANPAAARLLGAGEPDEIMGQPVSRFIEPTYRAAIAERMRQVLSGMTMPLMEERFLQIDGRAIDVEVASYPLNYQGLPAAQVIARDISARKQAEATLRHQHDYLAALHEITLGLLKRHDPEALLENIARQAGQLMGTPHVIIGSAEPGSQWLDCKVGLGLLGAARGSRIQSGAGLIGRVWQTGQPLMINDYPAWPDHLSTFGPNTIQAVAGVPLVAERGVIGVLGVAHDRSSHTVFHETDIEQLVIFARLVTLAIENAELLATERAARRQAETLQAAARALGATLDWRQVIIIILQELQKVVPHDSSSVFERQGDWLVWISGHGFPNLDALIGMKFHIADQSSPSYEVMRTQAPVIFADVDTHYAGFKAEPHAGFNIHSWLGVPMFFGEQVVGMLTMERRESGVYTPQHAEVALAFGTQAATAIQNARLYEQVRQHATELEQRVAERTHALTAAYEQLQELDQMKDAFVTRISHELRTPLANIRLYTELVERGKPEKRAEYLATLKQEGNRLNKLIEDLLDISELDMGRIPIESRPIELGRLIGDVLLDHRAQAEARHLALHYSPTADLPRVWADPALLLRVIVNLLSNALNYTPPGGSIHCATALQIRHDRSWVTLTVQDTGPGISPQEMPRLFERFYRGQAARNYKIPGTGLGLAISKEIMQKLGGSITVDSQPQHGAAFTMWLKTA
jgi:PAS domain S-box-containing protein